MIQHSAVLLQLVAAAVLETQIQHKLVVQEVVHGLSSLVDQVLLVRVITVVMVE